MSEVFKHSFVKFITCKNKDYCNIEGFSEGELNFYSKKKIQAFLPDQIFYTEESFVENYGNYMCSVEKQYAMLLVEKKENKVSLKVFWGKRNRLAGRFYFMVSKNMKYLTVNTKTGDCFHGQILNYNKKRKFRSSFQKNNFSIDYIKVIMNVWREIATDNCNSIFIDCLTEFKKALNFEQDTSCQEQILKFYLDKKNIKYPNNFKVYYNTNLNSLKMKDLKKTNLKLVDSFMEKNDLSGNNLKKALHLTNKIGLKFLKDAYDIFPHDWINKDYKLILKILEKEPSTSLDNHYLFPNYNHTDKFTKAELKKMFKIFLEVLDEKINVHSFRDHIRFINQLKSFGEVNLKWKAVDVSSFNDEHIYLTDLVQQYNDGKYFRIYSNDLIYKLQQPIELEKNTYFPIILLSSENYNQESSIQSNCVRSYIGKPSSLILSIRKNSKDAEERATMEIQFYKEKEKLIFTCPQYLGRFNGKLSEEWILPKNTIMDRLSNITSKEFGSPSITREFPNGKKLVSDSDWDKYGSPFWNSVDITNFLW